MIWQMHEGFQLKTPLTADKLKEANKWGEITLLNLNEAPESPIAQVETQLQQEIDSLNRYPDIKRAELSQAVAEQTGVPAEHQAWGAGASDLLYRAFNAVALQGKNAIAPTPTFWGYERIYRLTNVDIRRVELSQDCTTSIDQILAEIDDNTGLVSIVTPANPTGLSVTEDELITLAQRVPEDVLLLVDEVYFEFARDKLDSVKILSEYRKGCWAVLRSFSKAYALASARIGYALCSDEGVAHRLIESGLNFPVAGLSFAAANAVYQDPDFLTTVLKETIKQRQWISDELVKIGLEPLESDTNFVSVKLPIPAEQALLGLKEQGLVCGQWNHPEFANYIRITVGTAEENVQLVKALNQVLQN